MKLYPVGKSHIQFQATRPRTPSRVNMLNTSPGNSRNGTKLTRNRPRSDFVNNISGAVSHSRPHARLFSR